MMAEPSYFIVNDWHRYDENVVEAKNFAKERDIQVIINYIKNKDSSCMRHEHKDHTPNNDPEQDVFFWQESCLVGAGGMSTPFNQVANFLLSEMADAAKRYTMQPMRLAKVAAHVYPSGSSSPEHTDVYPLATLLYLNDDYSGGELSFPKHGIEFKPERGSLVVFNGGGEYAHEVKKIEDGDRYVLVGFWEYEDSSDLQTFWNKENVDNDKDSVAAGELRSRLESFGGGDYECTVMYPMSFPILQIQNFVTKEEAAELIDFLNANEMSNDECWGPPCFEEYWDKQYGTERNVIYTGNVDENTLKNLNLRIREAVEHFLDRKDISFSKFKGHDYRKGAYSPPHVHLPAIAAADLILNDGFVGGDTTFPSLSISLAPEALSLYVYAEDERFEHGVSKVLEGTRYSLASHWQREDHPYDKAGANL